jgi:hypothetical protein
MCRTFSPILHHPIQDVHRFHNEEDYLLSGEMYPPEKGLIRDDMK